MVDFYYFKAMFTHLNYLTNSLNIKRDAENENPLNTHQVTVTLVALWWLTLHVFTVFTQHCTRYLILDSISEVV